MPEYNHVVYRKGFAIDVTPEERSADVMHYLITGGLLGGRSLEGVTWEEVDNPAYKKACERSARMLAKSMRESHA